MSDLHHFAPTPQPADGLAMRVRRSHDGWLEVELDARHVPEGFAHAPGYVPRLSVSINGERPLHLGPDGQFYSEKFHAC